MPRMDHRLGKILGIGALVVGSAACDFARRLNAGIRHNEAFRTMPGIVYEKGFYPSESLREPSGEIHEIRWTGAAATAALPPWAGSAVLKFVVESPPERFKARPVVTLTLNGTPLDRFVLSKFYSEKTYLIPEGFLFANTSNSLALNSNETFAQPPEGGGETRVLALAVSGLRLEAPMAP